MNLMIKANKICLYLVHGFFSQINALQALTYLTPCKTTLSLVRLHNSHHSLALKHPLWQSLYYHTSVLYNLCHKRLQIVRNALLQINIFPAATFYKCYFLLLLFFICFLLLLSQLDIPLNWCFYMVSDPSKNTPIIWHTFWNSTHILSHFIGPLLFMSSLE